MDPVPSPTGVVAAVVTATTSGAVTLDPAMLEVVRAITASVIMILNPFIIAGLKRAFDQLPKAAIPILSPVIGVVIAGVVQYFGIEQIGGLAGAITVGGGGGLAAIGVRQVYDSAKKQQEAVAAGGDVPRVADDKAPETAAVKPAPPPSKLP